jgi:luciferase family oxidoreductase group 1
VGGVGPRMSSVSPVLSIPRSVLDLAPVGAGSTPADALGRAASLAAAAEALGYRRYWVAEHHNMPGIASSAPAVLLAHVAGATDHIRIGSGGVMLPNHAPLVVAEQFGMLEALHPGRVDLGIGRAPGTDQVTASALRRSVEGLSADDFPQALGELLGFFDGRFPAGHPYGQITAVPGLGYRPDLWLLGSSDYSAQVAGVLGLPFSFAHHFAAANTLPALAAYRATFRPSDELDRPYAMLGVAVLCAETEAQARYLAGPGKLAMARLRQGRPGVYPTPEEAAEHVYTPTEKQIIGPWHQAHVVGDPDQVAQGLTELVERTGADELIITTMAHGYQDRLRSYELVAEALALAPLNAEPSRSGHG